MLGADAAGGGEALAARDLGLVGLVGGHLDAAAAHGVAQLRAAGQPPGPVAAGLGLDRAGAALGRLVVVARPAHLVLRASFRSPSGALGTRKAEFAQERLRAAVGLHR